MNKEEVLLELNKIKSEYIECLYLLDRELKDLKYEMDMEGNLPEGYIGSVLLRGIVCRRADVLKCHELVTERELELWRDLLKVYEES